MSFEKTYKCIRKNTKLLNRIKGDEFWEMRGMMIAHVIPKRKVIVPVLYDDDPEAYEELKECIGGVAS